MKGKSNLLKKMMAMLLTAVLIIGMVVGAVPEEVHAEEGGFIYDDNGDGTVTITGYYGTDTTLAIPREIDGKKVISIGNSAFEHRRDLTTVTIPGSVISIGDFAFEYCSDLTTVTIPESVTSIGNGAFCYCNKLTTVTIDGNVTSMGDSAFGFCENLTTVTINGNITSIGDSAFFGCSNLTTITILGSVTSIDSFAFYGCSNLTTVTISEGVKSIGNFAFHRCSNLTTVTIPKGVISIGNGAFEFCEGLTKVTIPSSIKSIGRDAFYDTNPKLTVTYGSCKHNWAEVSQNESVLQTATKEGRVTYDPSISMTEHDKVEATCTEDGYKEEYYECSGCGRLYADEKGETPIDAETIIPAMGHTPADADEENRVDTTCAKEGSYDMVVRCSVCKAEISRTTKTIDKKAHSFDGWTVTKQPTESEEGLQERSCSVCGYKQTEVIPKTGNTGKIETEEEKGENTPDADFEMSEDELISAVLTPEEKSLVEAGADVKIILDIDNIDASVDEADKQAVTDKADGYNVGQYLDINLYKIIGEDKTKVSQTNGKVKIAIAVPDNLKNTDSAKTRSFAVVRVHDGVAELLADLDNDDATISFETDQFSTYALVYKDTVITDKKDDEPKTGDTTPMELYATLAMIAGLSYLLLLFGNRKRGMTEQEKKEWIAVLVAWGRKGGAIRKAVALVAIFLLLAYYHSIGKKINVKEVEASVKKKKPIMV